MIQVALSVILLICSGLMIRTFRAMMNVSPGFTSPQNVQAFGFYIPEAQIPDTSPELLIQMDEAILQEPDQQGTQQPALTDEAVEAALAHDFRRAYELTGLDFDTSLDATSLGVTTSS